MYGQDDKHPTFWQISPLFRHVARQHSLEIPGSVVFKERHFNNLGMILMPKQTVSHLLYRSRTILSAIVRYSSTPLILHIHSVQECWGGLRVKMM